MRASSGLRETRDVFGCRSYALVGFNYVLWKESKLEWEDHRKVQT